MPAYRYTCDRCREHVALAALDEVAPGIFRCTTPCPDRRRGRPADLAPASIRARDEVRDAEVNALRGAPIDNDRRADIEAWRLEKGSAA